MNCARQEFRLLNRATSLRSIPVFHQTLVDFGSFGELMYSLYMTLFDALFRMQSVQNRHNSAPLYRERAKFLTHMREQGCKESTIRQMASHLLQINRTLGFTKRMRVLTPEELNNAGRQWENYVGPLRRRLPSKYTFELYMRIARGWLRYHRCLAGAVKTRLSEERLKDFEDKLRNRIGLAQTTIQTRSMHASFFLAWLSEHRVRLRDTTVQHIERYLEAKRRGGWALETQILAAYSLRVFLRHAEERSWVRPGLFEAVPTFVRPKHSFVAKGPSWDGVQRIISSLGGKKPVDIRDRAMVLLMAVYGLRYGEIRDLRISDVDRNVGVLTVRRGKSWRAQRFPLNRQVSRAIHKYIACARPISDCRSLFLTFVVPHRPVSHGTVYLLTKGLFRRNEVESLRKGPHAFRHACAVRLMHKGTSVREIAAFLGHASTSSVREYTRYDLKALRRVAEFSLKGLL